MHRCPASPPGTPSCATPLLWHFSFGGPDAERLVAGRERIDLDRFWNEVATDPATIDEARRAHYAPLYAQPGAMRSAFAQFLAFPTDVKHNTASMITKLTMPVLAIGGAQSFGATMVVVMRNAATDVTEVVIPQAGHWLMEEQPAATMTVIRTFLDAQP
jgi:pimeloyl-ACP methyl ester carboxylesterase